MTRHEHRERYEPPRLSVVVAFGPGDLEVAASLAVTMASVVARRDTELVLVDDDADTAVVSALLACTGPVRLIHHRSALGRSVALQDGVSSSVGEVIVLLAPTVALDDAALAELAERFSSDPGVGVVGLHGDPGLHELVGLRRLALDSIGGVGILGGVDPTDPGRPLLGGSELALLARAGWRTTKIDGEGSSAVAPPWWGRPTTHRGEGARSSRWRATYRPRTLRPGINVVGNLRGVSELGDLARRYVGALCESGIELTTHPFGEGPRYVDGPVIDEDYLDLDTNLLILAPESLPALAQAAGEELWHGRHTIGLWPWDLEVVTAAMRSGFAYVDELWAPTEYLRQVLAGATDKTVSTVPLPVEERPAYPGVPRSSFGIGSGFTFLAVCDFATGAARHNVLGAIRAYRSAFGADEGPSLFVQTVHASSDPLGRALLRDVTEERRDVTVSDALLGDEELSGLIGSADCLISLHRAEGLGRIIAEAMAWGRPIVATAYSGPLDFLTEENAFLVGCDLVRVGTDHDAYFPPSARWAEPHLDEAVAMLRRVWENRPAATARGSLGRADIRRSHGVGTVAAAIRQRFDSLEHRRASGAPAAISPRSLVRTASVVR